MLVAPGVDKARIQKRRKFFALLVCKARIATVRFWIFQVDLRVGNIQIPAGDHRLFRLQSTEQIPPGVVPFHAVIQPRQLALRVRRVGRDEIIIAHIQRDHTALRVHLRNTNAVAHIQRLPAREDRRARVALFLRTVEKLLIARQLQIDLVRLQLRFLQRENIRIQRLEHIQKALRHTGAQPVDIPRDHFHMLALLRDQQLSKVRQKQTDPIKAWRDSSMLYLNIPQPLCKTHLSLSQR